MLIAMPKRERKNLSNLYGMSEVPDEIYKMIMRADDGKASPLEYEVLDEYIKDKTTEIRMTKMALGLEGQGPRRGPGRVAENVLQNLYTLFRFDDEDESDE